MGRVFTSVMIAAISSLGGQLALAQDPRIVVTIDQASLPKHYRVDGGLLLTAREAHRAVSSLSRVVLIDVRTNEETLFNGVAEAMHRHIPYVIADVDHNYDPDQQRYRLESNPYKAVDDLLREMKLDRRATIILYCSVGERSARAANLLLRSGFANAYSIAEGSEGDVTSRIGGGWKAAGLPWTYLLRRDQAYKNPSM